MDTWSIIKCVLLNLGAIRHLGSSVGAGYIINNTNTNTDTSSNSTNSRTGTKETSHSNSASC